MRKLLIWAAAISTTVATLMPTARAQEQRLPCADGLTVLNNLRAKYGEVPSAHGTSAGGAQVLFTLNPESGKWTFLAHVPPDLLCILAVGDGWRALPPPRVIVPDEPKPEGTSI